MTQLLKEIELDEKTVTFGDIVIDIDTPGLNKKLAEIIACAEKEFPDDMCMQAYEIGEGLKAFAKIAGLKAQLQEVGKSDEDADSQL